MKKLQSYVRPIQLKSLAILVAASFLLTVPVQPTAFAAGNKVYPNPSSDTFYTGGTATIPIYLSSVNPYQYVYFSAQPTNSRLTYTGYKCAKGLQCNYYASQNNSIFIVYFPDSSVGTAHLMDLVYKVGPTRGDVNLSLQPYSGGLVTQNGSYTITEAAPTKPGLSVSGKTRSSVSLSWSGSKAGVGANIDHYNVYQNSHRVATKSASSRSYTRSGLSCHTSYSFYVIAVDNYGKSTRSNTVSTTTSACPAPPPPAPVHDSPSSGDGSSSGGDSVKTLLPTTKPKTSQPKSTDDNSKKSTEPETPSEDANLLPPVPSPDESNSSTKEEPVAKPETNSSGGHAGLIFAAIGSLLLIGGGAFFFLRRNRGSTDFESDLLSAYNAPSPQPTPAPSTSSNSFDERINRAFYPKVARPPVASPTSTARPAAPALTVPTTSPSAASPQLSQSEVVNSAPTEPILPPVEPLPPPAKPQPEVELSPVDRKMEEAFYPSQHHTSGVQSKKRKASSDEPLDMFEMAQKYPDSYGSTLYDAKPPVEKPKDE